MENNLTNSLFDHMDALRHIPDYQLERRAEIFFYLFLPTILAKIDSFTVKAKEPIIPEFPVKKDMIDKTIKSSNQSIKIDYFAITDTSDAKRAFLIELKTDGNSIKTDQTSNLRETCNNNLFQLLEGVIKIIPHSEKKRKYLYLISRLAVLDLFVKVPDELEKIRKNKTLHGLKNALDKIIIKAELKEVKPEPVYILPTRYKDVADKTIEVITFSEIRSVLETINHPLAKRFAVSLNSWDDSEAGEA